ncbi:MAG: putative Cytochrome c biosis protein CcsA [Gemmatimonadetes bacterium]|nr:putative Cytochrome c biosis protein CcsA [Gemmatimonadota bacterium]
MIAIAHFVAISCYLGAAALAAVPFARPVRAPVAGVLGVLALGIFAHAVALLAFGFQASAIPLTGLGPSLSFAGLVLAFTLLVVEILARDVSLTLVAAPLAAIPTICANVIGLTPGPSADGARGIWLFSHIALSFVGIASFATAAVAGTMYLVQRHELKSRHFSILFRFFPPLATLDRVNHLAAIAGWLGLTLGVVLAGTYSLAYHELNLPQLVWGCGAWLAVTCLAVGRVTRGWQAQRAAKYSSAAFVAVLVLYVAFRVAGPKAGQFL